MSRYLPHFLAAAVAASAFSGTAMAQTQDSKFLPFIIPDSKCMNPEQPELEVTDMRGRDTIEIFKVAKEISAACVVVALAGDENTYQKTLTLLQEIRQGKHGKALPKIHVLLADHNDYEVEIYSNRKYFYGESDIDSENPAAELYEWIASAGFSLPDRSRQLLRLNAPQGMI